MSEKQVPVNDIVLFTIISKSNEANWNEVEKNMKWQYKRNPASTGFETFTIFNMANKKRVYHLDEKSELTYEIISFGTVRVKGQVYDYNEVPF
ncbi:MAG: hypothetical protein HY295_06165 [Thaumarchaeota archaeon]|nr:hypothetical protein [Nitrososphaerota archaeon]